MCNKYFLLSTFICLVLTTACSHITPEQIAGKWKIEKVVVDGIDRTQEYHNIPLGNGIEFNEDGTFTANRSNVESNEGLWKMNTDGSKIALYIDGDYFSKTGWKVTAGQQYLSLKTTNIQMQLSRTQNLPEPVRPVFSLKNNLPGTWLFYQIKEGNDIQQYRQSKSNPKWIKIFRNQLYESGEGENVFFRGNWTLQNDTILLQDVINEKEFRWKIWFEKDQLIFGEPFNNTSNWRQVSFINKRNIDLN